MKDDENTQSETDTTANTPENTQDGQQTDWEAQARIDEQPPSGNPCILSTFLDRLNSWQTRT